MKEEGWYLLLGSGDELLALKRVGVPVGRGASATLLFPPHNSAGAALSRVTVYLMSDSYLGLDQELTVRTMDGSGGESCQVHCG